MPIKIRLYDMLVEYSPLYVNNGVLYEYRELRKWWAQYMESTSEMETALQFYEAARDNLSLVRVYCYCGNLEKVRFSIIVFAY